jgi:uncharacterized protein (TIGR03000 family)
MARALFVALFLLASAQSLTAQPKARPSGFAGGSYPGSTSRTTITPPAGPPTRPSMPPPPAGISGGFAQPSRPLRPPLHPGYPFYGIWPRSAGWSPIYGYPVEIPVPVEVPVPEYVPGSPPDPPVELSGEMPATLVLEFPALAEVWVNGKKDVGDAQAEWTLTSPPVIMGTEYLFSVKAKWTANRRTFEYEKTVPVAAGSRARSLVLSGKEIKE